MKKEDRADAIEEQIWPYDDRGRLVGEDVLEVAPADVVTVEEAREKLNPLINPLPSFDEMVLHAS